MAKPGVVTDGGQIPADAVILATGHSAHDTFRAVNDAGVNIEPKGIAVGVRLEHPQTLIDRIQYHSKLGRGKFLPLRNTRLSPRSMVVGYIRSACAPAAWLYAGSEDGELVVNGMSASARAGEKANSGMVVEIHPGDFPEFSEHGRSK